MSVSSRLRVRRAILPVIVFLAILLIHYAWLGLLPDRDPAQDRWATVSGMTEPSSFQRYLETESYWLGYSYSFALAFAAVALRRYREDRSCGAKNAAIGSLSFSGFLAVAGCFLLGCCGSPMLVVYLNLFGAGFLPFARPLVAALTTLTILGAWLWMERRSKRAARQAACCSASGEPPTGEAQRSPGWATDQQFHEAR
jgi:hypothetical protein